MTRGATKIPPTAGEHDLIDQDNPQFTVSGSDLACQLAKIYLNSKESNVIKALKRYPVRQILNIWIKVTRNWPTWKEDLQNNVWPDSYARILENIMHERPQDNLFQYASAISNIASTCTITPWQRFVLDFADINVMNSIPRETVEEIVKKGVDAEGDVLMTSALATNIQFILNRVVRGLHKETRYRLIFQHPCRFLDLAFRESEELSKALEKNYPLREKAYTGHSIDWQIRLLRHFRIGALTWIALHNLALTIPESKLQIGIVKDRILTVRGNFLNFNDFERVTFQQFPAYTQSLGSITKEAIDAKFKKELRSEAIKGVQWIGLDEIRRIIEYCQSEEEKLLLPIKKEWRDIHGSRYAPNIPHYGHLIAEKSPKHDKSEWIIKMGREIGESQSQIDKDLMLDRWPY